MIVRCGGCRQQFEVPGPGRYGCPACGATNQVGGATVPPAQPGGLVTPPGAAPPAPPASEAERAQCPECSFSFIVGAVASVVCPNCNASVALNGPDDQEDA